jgi:hypothetical protein
MPAAVEDSPVTAAAQDSAADLDLAHLAARLESHPEQAPTPRSPALATRGHIKPGIKVAPA